MLNFPIGIVLYNPSESSVNRIKYFADRGIEFYIFDNSENSFERNDLTEKSIKYYRNGKNSGLSYSINFLCKEAILNGSEALLFFDQDTVFTQATLNYVDRFFKFKITSNFPILREVVSANFRDIELKSNKSNVIDSFQVGEYSLYAIYYSINSGTLYFLEKFNEFKWFDEEFFVDGVDYSFSLNTMINGYKNIAIANVPGLDHSEEQDMSYVTFFRKKRSFRVYSFRRNVDFLKSHFRLLFKSFKVNGLKSKIFIIKAMLLYISSQLVNRTISIINKLY